MNLAAWTLQYECDRWAKKKTKISDYSKMEVRASNKTFFKFKANFLKIRCDEIIFEVTRFLLLIEMSVC